MSFLYPQVLYGLFAVIIPILIHLFNFRRYQKVYFNNVALLKNLQKKTKKQSQLKQLLVLLMRILTIIALVLAFAGPYLPNKDAASEPQKTEYVSIYLDNSFSMTHLGENGSLLNEAQNMAVSILDSYENKDRFQLITNQMEGRHFRWFNKMEMMQNIMEVEPVHQQQELKAIFQREKMLRQQSDEEITLPTLYLLSDFQKNTSFNAAIQPDTTLKVRLLPLQNNPVNNLSIDTVYFRDPVQMKDGESVISLLLSNNGIEDQNSIPLRLFINEEQKAVLSVDIAAGSSEKLEISFTNTTSGKNNARIEIDDYPIVYDDRLYFSFDVREEFQMMLVFNDRPNPYLRKLYGEDSLIKLNAFAQNSVDYSLMGSQDLIILDELNILSSGLQSELENFVENGGHLLIIPGTSVAINNWLQKLELPEYGALINSQTRIKEINKQLSFYNRVFEAQWAEERRNQKIDLPDVFKYYPLNISEKSLSLLETRNGDNVLVQSPLGGGKIYQLGFPLQKEFSNLPEHALFVPVFYQLILQSEDKKPVYEVLGSGKAVKLSAMETSKIRGGQLVPELQMDEIKWIPQMNINRASEVVLSQVDWPSDGLANVLLDNEIKDQISVNFSRIESNFEVWTKDQLADLISENYWPGFKIIESTPQKITAQLIELNQSKQLWRWFLVFGIFFIFVETMILRLWK